MLFDAVDTLLLVLPAVAGALAECEFKPARMRAALSSTMMATDLADYLVRKGATFREAHGAVGRLVRQCEEEKVELHTLPLVGVHRGASAVRRRMCSTRCRAHRSVEQREVDGGTGPARGSRAARGGAERARQDPVAAMS